MRLLFNIGLILILVSTGCFKSNPNENMARLLSKIALTEVDKDNRFAPEAKLQFLEGQTNQTVGTLDYISNQFSIGYALLQMGKVNQSIKSFENTLRKVAFTEREQVNLLKKNLAIAYLRQGEQLNCINNHGSESCIFPIKNSGVYTNKNPTRKAIELLQEILKYDGQDLECLWLLNIAYMNIGEYPDQVPTQFLLKFLGDNSNKSALVKPFTDIAPFLKLDGKNMSGGCITEDFNNDGYLDLITSTWSLNDGMHYFKNNGNGSFSDLTEFSGLNEITGGLNIIQTDYNNDGLKDVFVLRGAWKGKFGKEPNSLLKNNGDGTFTDVTEQSGLLSFFPTQTATWADFNNDGWLDVFIGNESDNETEFNPCQFYINNKNGTFKDIAKAAGVAVVAFVKGVTSGDYNNDGLMDIFVSTLDGKKILFKNESTKTKGIKFVDVSEKAGLTANLTRTFPTWFWDYDNDGWLDILVCGYNFDNSLAWYAAAEALGKSFGDAGKIILYKNNKNGTFTEVSSKVKLNEIAFAMGANFGDIDNDGFLDMYLATGNPDYSSLIPNKLFKNINGDTFADVTSAARVGNLQKGHAVSFSDLDNDGDQDIYVKLGGAYVGDSYENSLYINPGQDNNHWINISLVGKEANRAAIGSKIKVFFEENGVKRMVYRELNSGGSFGANPLMQHIGMGKAKLVDSIEIVWPGKIKPQIFRNILPDVNYTITQGNAAMRFKNLNILDFSLNKIRGITCGVPSFISKN